MEIGGQLDAPVLTKTEPGRPPEPVWKLWRRSVFVLP